METGEASKVSYVYGNLGILAGRRAHGKANALQESTNFASAVMMRLVAAGLEKQGIALATPKTTGAHIPRPQKRDLLEKLEAKHGTQAVLALSDAVPDMPDEPVVVALRRARNLPDLLERWQRVEVFSHGRNRVHHSQMETGRIRLQHNGPSAADAPSRAESLLVLSVITRLAELTSAKPITVRLTDGQVLRRDGDWQALDLSEWDRSFTLSRANAQVGYEPLPPDADKLLAACRTLLLEDPVRRWSISDLAAETGVSARTLQRRLAEQTITFSALIFQTRLEKAAAYLCDKDGPSLAETGFLSGFTDQAHFARSFRRDVGTTPKAYRKDFAA